MIYQKIGCVADKSAHAKKMLSELQKRYNVITDEEDIQHSDVIIALGGDGFMLHTLHHYLDDNIPIYGMNCGTVGFLMNQCKKEEVGQHLAQAEKTILRPLEMEVVTVDNEHYSAIAINEVSLLRQTYQAAHISITIDNDKRIEELVCDGVLVATSAGSTAYNMSVGGPVVPLNAGILALTPISPFRPRRWNGALLSHTAEIHFDIQHPHKRPVSAVADFNEVRDAKKVIVRESKTKYIEVLFDPDHSLEKRIIKEQFSL